MSLAPSAHDIRVARNRLYLEAKDKDPLSVWRFGVPRLREAFRLFTGPEPINELHMRKPNRSGGTFTLAAWMVSCCQKRTELDGVPVPQWKGRVEAVQFVLDYKRQLLSVQPAYERVLGRWPHKIRRSGAAVSDIRIKPIGGSDDEATWSIVHFLSEDNPRAAVGIRADLAGFDEPPPISILQEMRKAAHAGRPSQRVIAETPEHLREWAPIRADYGDTPRSTLRRVDRWRAEVRWSLDEIENWVLSQAEKQEMREQYWDVLTGKARDPIAEARWFGDYTNAEGSTPWGEQGMLTLLQMLELCTEPEIWTFPIPMETEDGVVKVSQVDVQVWKEKAQGMSYYQDIDPASGVDDGKHNPAALHESEQGSGDLCARWNGYLQPYQVGVLGASVGRQFNDSVIDVETNDHWGVNVVRGLERSRYGNIAHEQRELRPGQWAKEVGFKMNEESKAVIIGQIQEWLAAWGAYFQAQKEGRAMPRPYAFCPSREVIESLINAELDERGKVVNSMGVHHGEDMILWGQKLRRAVTRSNRAIPQIHTPAKSADQALADMVRNAATRQPQVGRRVSRHRSAPRG